MTDVRDRAYSRAVSTNIQPLTFNIFFLGEPVNITFRPVTDEDDQFLFKVYASTRAEELSVVGWSDAQKEVFLQMQFQAQKVQYREHYPEASFQIILLDDRPVGRLYMARLEDQIRIIDIALLTDHRGRGIGEPIIRNLCREAAERDVPARIYVDSFSRSRRLFERLGFRCVEDNQINALMEWSGDRKT
jgi:RimJ/RimL family protein N-acetyltransferase